MWGKCFFKRTRKILRNYEKTSRKRVKKHNLKNATNSTNAELRFYLAHEFMHILYGSDDVNEYESKTTVTGRRAGQCYTDRL